MPTRSVHRMYLSWRTACCRQAACQLTEVRPSDALKSWEVICLVRRQGLVELGDKLDQMLVHQLTPDSGRRISTPRRLAGTSARSEEQRQNCGRRRRHPSHGR
ncbi:MAG: hypothetical protein WCE40_06665 [Polyangia bacterium]